MFLLRFAKPTAGESFAKLPRGAQVKFNKAFQDILENSRSSGRNLEVHQPWGYQNAWTLSIPPWRGIYAIDGNEVVFIVFGRRNQIYALLHSLLPPDRRYVSASRGRKVGSGPIEEPPL
jgi:mRNA-degrading endonuclease RelE of RelBE toxin-antitoxin system